MLRPQGVQAAPRAPHTASAVPSWQTPVLSQQPAQVAALHWDDGEGHPTESTTTREVQSHRSARIRA
jgi:hypothetical protein